MKKIFLYLFASVLVFSGCKKNDDYVFNQTPDERINETLSAYQAQLAGAENGWKVLLTVDSGRGPSFTFYFKFNDANRVTMISDFDSASAVTPKESSYRLKALQQPSLIFDTYSYLHVLSDPDAFKNGGIFGLGLSSDFEFFFSNVSGDTIKLIGRYHGSTATLVKATKEEGDAFMGGRFVLFSNYINKILTYFKRFVIGSQTYDVSINPYTRTMTFSWLDGSGNVQTFSTTYYNILNGAVLSSPLLNGNTTITGFSNGVWDATTSTLTVKVGDANAAFTPTVFPVKIDANAGRRWWQYAVDNGNSYWISLSGFHVNGVDDAFGITTLERYYYLIYWPEYDVGNDLFAPVFLNTAGTALELQYGAAPATPTFTAGGIVKFPLLGYYGAYPTSGPAYSSLAQLIIPEGYYFVQTGETTYDMVSAADGKAWVNWIW